MQRSSRHAAAALFALAATLTAAGFAQDTATPDGHAIAPYSPQAPSARPPIRYPVSPVAVAAALTAAGLPTSAAQLRMSIPLYATTPSPELHIRSAEPRPDASLRLRVVCSNPVECMPFFASIEGAANAASLAVFAAQPAPPRPAAGVAVGAHVTLELADRQMRIHLPAVAIDTGAPGAEVRVASLDRKHTWRGVVVDAGTVKGGVE